MRRVLNIFILVFFVFCVSVSGLNSQSVDLVELQKKEKDRRKKLNVQQLKPGEKNITRVKLPDKRYGFSLMSTGPGGSSSGGTEKQQSGGATAANKKVEPEKTEEYWRNLKVRLDNQIAELEQKIQKDQLEINQLYTRYYSMDLPLEKNRLQQQLDQMNSKMQENKTRLQYLKNERDDLSNKARKAGVPPGWVR